MGGCELFGAGCCAGVGTNVAMLVDIDEGRARDAEIEASEEDEDAEIDCRWPITCVIGDRPCSLLCTPEVDWGSCTVSL